MSIALMGEGTPKVASGRTSTPEGLASQIRWPPAKVLFILDRRGTTRGQREAESGTAAPPKRSRYAPPQATATSDLLSHLKDITDMKALRQNAAWRSYGRE